MLKIDTELAWDTKKSKTVNVEDDERREAELFETEVINEKVNSRKFKAKDWNWKRCDLKANDSIKDELFEFDCRNLKLKKRAARETTISRLNRSIARRKNVLINNQSTE